MMSELKDRLRTARNNADLTQTELGDKIGVSQTAINKIEIGKTLKPRNILEIANALNVTPEWLVTGENSNLSRNINVHGTGKTSVLLDNLKNRQQEILSTMIPVISWVQAGAWCDAVQYQANEDDFTQWYPCPEKHSERTFALKVRGESMSPDFIDGEIIYVDPEVEEENGSCVVVRQNGDTEATFKQLMLDGDKKYLKALNPSWPNPIIEMLPDATICGVVIGSYRRRK